MAHLMGGPKMYMGRMPNDAHMHMFIGEDLFAVRQGLLISALIESGVSETDRNDWINIDGAFKKVILKSSIEHCKKRYATDEILSFPDPTAPKARS